MDDVTPRPSMFRRRSSAVTPLMDALENPPRPERRATDEIRMELSPQLTPSGSRRLSIKSTQPVLDSDELDKLMKNCLEMATKNKFTDENVWGLPLIDHLPDLVKSNDLSSTEFDRLSAGLTTAVQIYTKRVDSTLTQALEAMHRISKTSKRQEEGGNWGDVSMEGGEEEEEDEPVMASQAMRRKVKKHVKTLAKLEDILEVKTDVPSMDGAFDELRARLDQGGCNGMMAQLGLCGLQWRSNPNRPQEGPMTLDTTPDDMMDVSHIRDLFWKAPPVEVSAVDMLREILDASQPLPQSQQEDLRVYMEEAEDCLRRQEGYQSFYEEPIVAQVVVDSPMQDPELDAFPGDGNDNFNMGDGMVEDEVNQNDAVNDFTLPGEANIDVNFFEMDDAGAVDGGDNPAVDIEEQVGEGPSFHVDGNNGEFQPNGTDDDEDFDPLPQDLRDLMMDSDERELLGKSKWSHWKYQNSNAKPKRPRKPRREKPEVDWENLPVIEQSALQVAEDESKINLKSRKNPKVLKPENHQIKASFIAEGFFKSRMLSTTHTDGKQSQTNLTYDGLEPTDENWRFDDTGGGDGIADLNFDFADVGDGGGEPEVGASEFDEDGFLKEPEKIHHIAVERPKFTKQVNMDTLKKELHQILKSLSQKTAGGIVCFSTVVSRIMESRGEDAVSVQVCFIALLHLANEHGLQIENTPNLQEMYIKLPDNFI